MMLRLTRVLADMYLNPEPPNGYYRSYHGIPTSDEVCEHLHSNWLTTAEAKAYKPKLEAYIGKQAVESINAEIADPGRTKVATFYCQSVIQRPTRNRRDGPWALLCPGDAKISIQRGNSRWNGRFRRFAICVEPESSNTSSSVYAGTTECISTMRDEEVPMNQEIDAWVTMMDNSQMALSADSITWSKIDYRSTSGSYTVLATASQTSYLELRDAHPRTTYRACVSLSPGRPNARMYVQ